jgi:hypothetical protein
MSALDWEWALRTGGNLSAADRHRLVPALLRGVPRLAAERVRAGRRGHGRLDLDTIGWPDSPLAAAAEAEAREVATPHVLEHSYRTYLFGLVLAGLDGVVPDRESAFAASMLHDLQLEHPTAGRCFAVVGGERAHRICLDHGADSEQAVRIGAGVAGHLTPGVADDLADLAGFVSAGALVDVAGARLRELDPQWVNDVLVRHPRHDFKRHLTAAIRREAEAVPDGRISWLSRWAGFARLIAAAPFTE